MLDESFGEPPRPDSEAAGRLPILEAENRLYLLEISVMRKKVEVLEARLASAAITAAFQDRPSTPSEQLALKRDELKSARQLITTLQQELKQLRH